MLTLESTKPTRSELAAIDEHAAWMIVVAAEKLASSVHTAAGRDGYSEVARRLRAAARARWHDPAAIRAASPVLEGGPGGGPGTLVEAIARFHHDPHAGVREAEECLMGRGWRMADASGD